MSYKKLAIDICLKLREVGIIAYTDQESRNNSIYIRFSGKNDIYDGIRIADHQGKLERRYCLRMDTLKSEKIKYAGKMFYMYSKNDINGMLMRIKKEMK